MNRHEFELLAHVEISDAEFERINLMYMNAGDMDKAAFCAAWVKRGDGKLLDLFFDQSDMLRDKLDIFREKMSQAASLLVGKAHAYNDPDLRREAVRLVGPRRVVLMTMKAGYPLWEEDIQFIEKNLKENVSK